MVSVCVLKWYVYFATLKKSQKSEKCIYQSSFFQKYSSVLTCWGSIWDKTCPSTAAGLETVPDGELSRERGLCS